MPNYNLDVTINVNKRGRGLEDLNNSVQKSSNLLGTLSVAAGSLLAEGLQVAAREAVEFVNESNEAFSEFDKDFRQVLTLIPGQSEEMKRELTADALEIGKELGRLPDEVLPAMYQALSLGIPEENIFEDIKTASQAARAGNAELEETLVTGQSIVNAYGEGVYDLTEVYDILFSVVKNGAVTFGDINAGMSAITSAAGEAGVSLEDIGASIITMTKQGDDFSEVSDLMSNALTQLAIDGTALGSAFSEAAGTSFKEYISQGHTFVEALTLMQEHADATGQSLISMVGGDSSFYRDVQAARAIVELTGKHLGDMAEASDLTHNSLGATAEAAAEMAGSMEIAEQKAAAATAAMKVMLGEALAPTRKAWLEAKTAAAEYWAEVFENAAVARSAEDVIGDLAQSYDDLGASQKDVRAHQRELNRLTEYWSQSNTDAATAERILIEADRLLRSGYEGTTAQLYAVTTARIANMDAAEQEAAVAQELASVQADYQKQAFESRAAIMAQSSAVGDLRGNIADVAEVLDGDTLKIDLEGEVKTLRFRNVNTPEIDHGEGAMPWAEEAMEFTQAWIDNNPIEIGAELNRESYGRIIASVPELEEALVREGLAIPLPATLSEDPEAAAQFQAAVMEAASAGVGMFEDQELAARVLSGELVDLGAYYVEIAEREAELRGAYTSTIGPVTELLAAQQELAEAQGAGAEAAEARVTAAQEEIQRSYQETAIAAFEAANAGNAGALQSFLDLQVAVGNMTQEAADARLEMATMTIEAETLGTSLAETNLTADQQANAIQLLADGYVTTAEEAINLAGAFSGTTSPAMIAAASDAETLYDPLHRIGSEPFDAQITADTSGAINDVNALQNEINGLHDKTVTVTIQEKRVGGRSFEDFLSEGDSGTGFATGTDGWWTVPGQIGEPQHVTVHGGEEMNVIPAREAQNQQTGGSLMVNVTIQSSGDPYQDGASAVDGAINAAKEYGYIP